MFVRSFVLYVLVTFAASACSTGAHRTVHIADSEYKQIVEEATKTQQAYEGLVNTIDLRATLLTMKVREAQTLKKATNFQWTDEEIKSDRDYARKSALSETKIFLSFFTPEVKDDNLNKVETVWRIFLDVENKRYQGTVQKMTDTPSEVMDLYPEHTRWGTAYMVKFPVPTGVVENASARLTITGPVGSASVNF